MSCCVTVEQSEVGLIENWGKFDHVAEPGCHCLTPCKQTMAGKLSLRVMDHECIIESKTKDNVFVNIKVSVQYQVLPNAVHNAFYMLSNPIQQIRSYIFNSIRGQVPTYEIDQIFLMRSEIAEQVKKEIDDQMDKYGYDIVTVLITEVEPAASVRDAMNPDPDVPTHEDRCP